MCEKEHHNEDDATLCEQACIILGVLPEKIDADEMTSTEKGKVVKDLARIFRRLWDEGGEYRKFYAQLSSE
jgi:predicted ribosome-associated RNA-binding protein Tma20